MSASISTCRACLHALGVDETRLIQNLSNAVSVEGTAGVDYIYVNSETATTYNGGQGADIFFIGKNFGEDVIADVDNILRGEKPDQIRFAHARSTDVYALRDGQDLVITVNGTDDVLRVRNQFLGDKLDPLFKKINASPATQIASIVFADGVIWDRLEIAKSVSHPLDSDDLVLGTQSKDYLEGGKGNDIIRGGRDGDIYVFKAGDGNDRIAESNDWWSDTEQNKYDFLQFGGAINPENIKLYRAGESGDVLITVLDANGAPTGDSMLIEDQFYWANIPFLGLLFPHRIESIGFSDGSFMSHTDLMARVLSDLKTDNADIIFGFNNDDELDGGKGDDVLVGRAQNDTYIYGRNYGRDVVEDGANDFFGGSFDTLKFTDGLRWTDFEFERQGASATITMRVKGTEDAVILKDQYVNEFPFGFRDMIERLEYADGTVWDYFKLAQHVIDLASTSGDDLIYGFDIANSHDGGAGDDRIEGAGGGDTYIFGRGYGTDTIFDSASGAQGDRLILTDIALDDVDFSRAANDLILTVRATGDRIVLDEQYNRYAGQKNAVESFVFSDRIVSYKDLNPEDIDLVGTAAGEALIGTDFAETIDGRAGNDTLTGGSDGDTYLFDVGYGHDTIFDRQTQEVWLGANGKFVKEGDDTIRFGDDITVENADFVKDGDDLLISVLGHSGDTLRVVNQFRSISDGIEWFAFADGTRWHISDIEERLAIVGGSRGDDKIEGALNSPNVLDGREGDDTLIGGREGDTYAFGGAYDLDEITERTDGVEGAIDRVVFGDTVNLELLKITRDGFDLIFDLGNGEDRLTIKNGLSTRPVEQFIFANGTMLGLEEIRTRMLIGDNSDEVLVGFDGRSDVLDGGAGSDALEGRSGDDEYRFGAGSGADSAEDTAGVDRIVFADNVTSAMVRFSDEDGDLLVRLEGEVDTLIILGGALRANASRHVETFVFSDGTIVTMDEVWGLLVAAQESDGSDVINARNGARISTAGDLGDDLIYAADETTITFKAGDGLDTIDTTAQTPGSKLVFTDLDSTDAVVRHVDLTGPDLAISFPASGDMVRIRGALESGSVPVIEFADGVIWDRAAFVAAAMLAQASARDDVITGSSLADRISGLAGVDDIQGAGGNDKYFFTRGDGRDVISDSSGTDALEIRGYRPEDVIISRPVAGRDELLLSFNGTDDEILLRMAGGSGVDSISFGDGTTWSRAFLFAAVVANGTPFDDEISATAAADILSGGAGNDSLAGLAGNDTYTFARGDGRDIINDQGASSDVNSLTIADYGPADTTVIRHADRPNDLVLRFPGGDEIVIVGGFNENGKHVSKITFQNGVVWTMAEVLFALAASRQSGQDEILLGTSAADTLVGEGGSDYLSGGSAGDTYVFRRGDGEDVIEDLGSTSAASPDKIDIRGYLPSEMRIERSLAAPNDFVITFAGTQDRIHVVGGIGTAANIIESIRFEDGTIVTHAQIIARTTSDAATSGDDTVEGYSGAEQLSGGLGNDRLSGGDGSDTYVFARGDGRDVIEDNGYFDTDIVRISGLSAVRSHFVRTRVSI